MRINAVKGPSGWGLFPESGRFEGKLVAVADGLSMESVTFVGQEVCGEVIGVWGMEVVEPTIYDDPKTIRGLGLGLHFNMRDQEPVLQACGAFYLDGKAERLVSAKALWVLGDDMQAYGAACAHH